MVLDEKYRDELLIALRMHEISGERVGEVLAEVEAHVRETGEDPVEAFGKPREYAAQVAEQLDASTGKPSTLGVTISVLATAALTMFGSDFLLDALFERTDSIAYTLKDTVALTSLLVLFVAGTLLAFKAYTAKSANKIYAIAMVLAFGLGILAQYVAGQVFDDTTPLYELPRWGAGVLGALALAGAIAFLVRAARRGRVVYPKVG
ncbi:HAAS signaling domain-containing protein [Saccharopolyspora sp. NPDC002376]